MALKIRNLSNTDYTTIQDIFEPGSSTLTNYTNISLTFTTLLSGIDPFLLNSPTGFQVGGIDISSTYLADYNGPYSQMVSAIDVTFNGNSAYRYINFFLQSPGGNGRFSAGCGGSGAFVFGRVDLSIITTATRYTVFVPEQSQPSTVLSYISFYNGASLIATISCTKGNPGRIGGGGDGGTYTAPTVTGITYKYTLTGITGASGGNTVTKNPYINANTSYNNTFQPITSLDNTLYGAGGSGNVASVIGKPGLAYVWFTR